MIFIITQGNFTFESLKCIFDLTQSDKLSVKQCIKQWTVNRCIYLVDLWLSLLPESLLPLSITLFQTELLWMVKEIKSIQGRTSITLPWPQWLLPYSYSFAPEDPF